MIFLDIYNDWFSDAPERIQNLVDGDAVEAFMAFSEMEWLLEHLRADVCLSDSEGMAALREALRGRFISAAEAQFERLWNRNAQQGYATILFNRSKGLRLLNLAHREAAESEKETFLRLYQDNVHRYFALGGTLKQVEEIAADQWAWQQQEMAIEVLQAGIICHSREIEGIASYTIALGTAEMRKQLQKYTADWRTALEAQAATATEPQAVEALLVRALKVYALGHGLNRNLLRKVWRSAEANLVRRLEDTQARMAQWDLQGDLQAGRVRLNSRFWFYPQSQQWRWAALETALQQQCEAWHLGRVQQMEKLPPRLTALAAAVQQLAPHLAPNSPLFQQHQQLEALSAKLEQIQREAEAAAQQKNFEAVVRKVDAAEKQLQQTAAQFKSHLTHPPVQQVLTRLRDAARAAISKATTSLQAAREATDPLRQLELTASALNIWPEMADARQLRKHLARPVAAIFLTASSQALHLKDKIRPLEEWEALRQQHEMAPDPDLQTRLADLQHCAQQVCRLEQAGRVALQQRACAEALDYVVQARRCIADTLPADSAACATPELDNLQQEASAAQSRAAAVLSTYHEARPHAAIWCHVLQARTEQDDTPELRKLQESLEQRLRITGGGLVIRTGGLEIHWLHTPPLRLARDGGHLPLTLESASAPPCFIEFDLSGGSPVVRDRHSTNGLYQRTADGALYDLGPLRNAGYRRIPPGQPFPLTGRTELLLGFLGRLICDASAAGLVLSFPEPYLPEELPAERRPAPQFTLSVLWPDHSRMQHQIAVLAPNTITLGAGDRALVRHPHLGCSLVTLHKTTPGFDLTCDAGITLLPSGGQAVLPPLKEAPVLKSTSYQIGPTVFNIQPAPWKEA